MKPAYEVSRERSERNREGKARSLAELSVTVWLTPENAVFFRKNGLLWLTLNERAQGVSPQGSTVQNTEPQDVRTGRVTLCRAFPFDQPWEYISVLDEEGAEMGMIRSTEQFTGEMREAVETELTRRYYAPELVRILSVRERYGFSYWKAETGEGEVRFTLHDTFRSILHVNSTRLIFLDVNGNRFEIPDVQRLDDKSRRKLELYL